MVYTANATEAKNSLKVNDRFENFIQADLTPNSIITYMFSLKFRQQIRYF